jgi:hypothetical protein
MELIQRNKILEAIRVQALGFKIAAHVGQHPTLAAYRVAHAVEAVTSTGLTKIIYLTGGNGDIAKEVRNAIERNWKPRSFLPALRTEIAFEMDQLEKTRRNGLADLDAIKTQLPPISAQETHSRTAVIAQWNALIDKTAIYLLKTAREILPYFNRPYLEARPRLRAITELAKATATRPTSLQFTFFPEAIDDYLEGYTEQIYGQLKVQTLRTGAAVLAVRAVRKDLPRGLSEVLQPVPTDLFTLQPLAYRAEGRGFVVYSMGEEGRYGGGSPQTRPRGASAVFRFPLPDYFRAN